MKKLNPLTLAFVLSVTFVVILAGVIATRPIATSSARTTPASTLAIPF